MRVSSELLILQLAEYLSHDELRDVGLGEVRAVQAIEAVSPSNSPLKLRPGPTTCLRAVLEETVRLAGDVWAHNIDKLHYFLVIVPSESVVEVEVVVANLGVNTLLVHLLLPLLKQVVHGLGEPIFVKFLLTQQIYYVDAPISS